MKVLVTGASRGIGYEISKELLESNHNVVMHCNQNKKALEGLQKKHANKSHIVTADLSNLKEIKELINQQLINLIFRTQLLTMLVLRNLHILTSQLKSGLIFTIEPSILI